MNLTAFTSAVSSLIFTTRCPSCLEPIIEKVGRFGICVKCEKFLRSEVSVNFRGPLKIYAGSKYTPNISRIILAAKEENHREARVFLAQCLTSSLKKAILEVNSGRDEVVQNVVLIPIPSRKLADRKRGFAHIELLVKQFISMNQKTNFQVLDCLNHSRKISDQTSLNFNERAMNMRGAFSINPITYFEIYPTRNSNSAVFLVDDLVTSGATVQAANCALFAHSGRVDGVLASCATPGFTH